jgi:hypothetical protein
MGGHCIVLASCGFTSGFQFHQMIAWWLIIIRAYKFEPQV